MSTQAELLNRTANFQDVIQQGATFSRARRWGTYPRPVRLGGCNLIYCDTGQIAPDSDFIPIDFTGCSGRMQLRRAVLDPDVLLEFSTIPAVGRGGIELGADGWVTLNLTAEQTAALPYGKGAGQWTDAIGQLEVTFADGTVVRLFELRVTLSPEVTR